MDKDVADKFLLLEARIRELEKQVVRLENQLLDHLRPWKTDKK